MVALFDWPQSQAFECARAAWACRRRARRRAEAEESAMGRASRRTARAASARRALQGVQRRRGVAPTPLPVTGRDHCASGRLGARALGAATRGGQPWHWAATRAVPLAPAHHLAPVRPVQVATRVARRARRAATE